MTGAYYNEIDPYASAWLRNLIDAGLLPAGDVDERSIEDVAPEDVAGYTQCHFFAGIGGWPYALRLAGWPDDAPAWTGSCPCQPFSVAGAGKGTADERHLWPAFHRLIAERRPPVCFGEQVASADGRLWLAGVRADLEALGYAVGAADLCAAGISAPHIRQRLYWVAQGVDDATGARCTQAGRGEQGESEWGRGVSGMGRGAGGLADAGSERRQQVAGSAPRHEGAHGGRAQGDHVATGDGEGGGLGDADDAGLEGRGQQPRKRACELAAGASGTDCRLGDASCEQVGRAGQPRQDFWRDSVLIPCGDGKARRIEPGIPPLVTRLSPDMGSVRPGEVSPYRALYDAEGKPIGQAPWRIGMLKAYGNAIVPPLAAEFVTAYLDVDGRGVCR